MKTATGEAGDEQPEWALWKLK